MSVEEETGSSRTGAMEAIPGKMEVDGGSPSTMPHKNQCDGLASQTHIHDLPDLCLIHIFGHLCAQGGNFPYYVGRDVRVYHPLLCALVCKHWCSLADAAVHTLKLPIGCYPRDTDPRQVLVQTLPRWIMLTHLDLDDYVRDQTSDATFGALSTLPSLRHLTFSYFGDGLPAVCARVGALTQLATLDLRCSEVPPLTGSHCRILKHLSLQELRGERLPALLSVLSRLVSLAVDAARDLRSLPESVGRLSNLTRLEVARCGELEALPEGLGRLGALRELWVSECGKLASLPGSIGSLVRLEKLLVRRTCPLLRKLPDSVGELRALRLLTVGKEVELPESLMRQSGLEIMRV